MQRTVVVGVVAGLVATLGACSSGSGHQAGAASSPTASSRATAPANAVTLVAAAQGKVLGTGSAHVTSVTTSATVRVTVDGVVDFRHLSGDFHEAIAGSGSSITSHVLIVNGVVYAQVPGSGTSHYLKLDLRSLLSRGGTGSGIDPTSQLSLLLGASKAMHVVGQDVIRGVPTTHIAGTLDVSRAAAAVAPQLRSTLQALQGAMHLPTSVPVDVWVDNAGLCRRLRISYHIPAEKIGSTTTPATTAVTTTDYYGFGVAVHVAPPPAADVVGGPSLG